ncbi:hypothetical protein Tco_0743401 [Tanacetum coccineum]
MRVVGGGGSGGMGVWRWSGRGAPWLDTVGGEGGGELLMFGAARDVGGRNEGGGCHGGRRGLRSRRVQKVDKSLGRGAEKAVVVLFAVMEGAHTQTDGGRGVEARVVVVGSGAWGRAYRVRGYWDRGRGSSTGLAGGLGAREARDGGGGRSVEGRRCGAAVGKEPEWGERRAEEGRDWDGASGG